MIIISTEHQYEPYFNGSYSIDDTSTGRKRPVLLVLYRDMVRNGFSETVARKPIAKFFDTDDKEIPPRQWTSEMKTLVKQEILNHPVERHHKLTVLAKVFFAIGGLVVMVGIAAIIYGVFVSGPKKKSNRAAFTELPAAGDRFYGSLFGQAYMSGGKLRAGWAIVESVNPQDSMIQLRLSEEIGDFTFVPKTMEHDTFEGPIFITKFSSDGRKNTFTGIEMDFVFESTVYNDDFGTYKLPATND
ncbi:hypothetical protein [Parapedobacter sp.]